MRSIILAASAIVAFGVIGQAAPAAAQPFSIQSCHREVLRHSHPGVGTTWHYHSGRNCRVVRADPPKPADCHSEPRRHYVPGLGNVWHRHVGNNCRAVTLRRVDRNQGPSCVRLGPIWYCP